MSKSEKSSISIERNKNWFGKGRPANVIVNNEIIGTLKDGEQKHFSVSPGSHTVIVQLGKLKTDPINITLDVGKNKTLEYWHKSHLNISGLCILGLMAFIATIFLQYLKIHFIISLLIASLVMSGCYTWLENKGIVPPFVIINESLNVVDASILNDIF